MQVDSLHFASALVNFELIVLYSHVGLDFDVGDEGLADSIIELRAPKFFRIKLN